MSSSLLMKSFACPDTLAHSGCWKSGSFLSVFLRVLRSVASQKGSLPPDSSM